MSSITTLAWFNILLLFALYSVLLAIIARVMKLGHVLGVVYGVALLVAYLTRDVLSGIAYSLGSSTCALVGFTGLVLANFIIDYKVK